MLPFLIVPVLVGLSMLVQRPLSRWLGVTGPIWPLLPFAPSVRWSHRLSIRGAGLLFTFLLVLAGIFLQTRREQRLLAGVKVAAGMAAEEAGVLTNDVITAVDGVAVEDFGALREQLLQGAPTKRLTLLRDGVVLERSVTLRNGVLGVQPSGASRETTSGEALQRAVWMLGAFPVTYSRLVVRTVSPSTPLGVSGSGAPAGGPPAWLLAISISLAFSWWLSLAVEVGALGLGLFLQRRAVLRPGP